MADKPALNSHPIFKDYDRIFFDPDGDLIPSTLCINKDGSWMRLTNLGLDFDHPMARKHATDGEGKSPLSPLVTVYEGSGSFLEYSWTVECMDEDSPLTYCIVMQSNNLKTNYFAGMTKVAKKDGLWCPITQLEFNDFADWLQDITHTEIAFEYWLQRVQNQAKARCLKTATELIFEVSSQRDKDAITKFTIHEGGGHSEPTQLQLPKPEEVKKPEPPPLVIEKGYTVDIGNSPVHAEKVLIDG